MSKSAPFIKIVRLSILVIVSCVAWVGFLCFVFEATESGRTGMTVASGQKDAVRSHAATSGLIGSSGAAATSTITTPLEDPAGTQCGVNSGHLDTPDLPLDFLDLIVSGHTIALTLPDGRQAAGGIEMIRRDACGVLFVQGRMTLPEPGRFFFQRQTLPGLAGAIVGNVRFDGNNDTWKIEPSEKSGTPRMVARKLDDVICSNYKEMPEAAGDAETEIAHAPQSHPTDIPTPFYQNVIPLQSLPGATPVVYLDFDGEPGPFPGWGDFDAAPAGTDNSQIFDVWKMVCEDFQGFNLNVTTDRRVFDQAAEGRRVHCIITPTKDAAPTMSGVSYVGSFNWTGDTVCWAFCATGKVACEVISHEVGHTLGLSHDGRINPAESYYAGHGTGPTGWAPIMGAGYYKTLSQWSKGEYLGANQRQDDLSIIVNTNNDVAYRIDDTGDVISSARYLEIAPDNSVSCEGIIEKTGDVDAFRFVTTGGPTTLNVNTVSLNPNLDILAEIVDAATSTVVASDNPDLGINASVSASLTAGEYLLRIRGTGRGNPLSDGYTNYGSLGSYLVSGSVIGGIKPERFTIAENSCNGSVVGVVLPRDNHGGANLTYAITSGNPNGAFTINPATGVITVGNAPALDFEAISSRWDVPATLDLFVAITDPANSTLNEVIRTVVTVLDVNEAPTITGGSATMLEHSPVGTKLLQLSASDQDHFDFVTFSITAGNTDSAFTIDRNTGQITVATDISVPANTVFNLTVQAADQGNPALASTATVSITVVNIADGYQPGRVLRTYFENITGSTVANLTGSARFPNNPDSEEYLTSFDGPPHGDNYGSTIRGYLIPPFTGSYQFWIASNDSSQLRLGADATPASAGVIAVVSGWTNPYAWTTNTSQHSALVRLTAGQPYFIEARHKAEGGDDHLAVAWSGPGITRQVISGNYLAPYSQNYAPQINATTFSVREDAYAGQTIGVVTTRDVNSQDSFAGYLITGGNSGGVFGIDPVSGRLHVAQSRLLNAAITPSFHLAIQATDDGTPPLAGSGVVTVNVVSAGTINGSGIVQEIWTGITGTALSGLTDDIRFPYRPTVRRTLAEFDSGSAYGDNYGSRIRAKFVPSVSGDYRFYLSGDEEARLLFSNNEVGIGAVQIADVSLCTDHNEWTKYQSQASGVVTLVAGHPVYLETLQKEGGGSDHVSVGYTGPEAASITVIPRTMLEPFDINAAPVFSAPSYSFSFDSSAATLGMEIGSVIATDPNGESLVFAILSSSTQGAFAINSATGTISIANPALLNIGDHTLQVAAQDGGLGSVYPLASTTAVVAIHVTSGTALDPDANHNGILDAWEIREFGNADPGNNAADGDADHDGLSNLLEFALGTHPTQPNASPLAVGLAADGGEHYLRLSLPKNPEAKNLKYLVEVCGDLTCEPWSSLSTLIVTETPDQLTVRDTQSVESAPQRFIRLKVSSLPQSPNENAD